MQRTFVHEYLASSVLLVVFLSEPGNQVGIRRIKSSDVDRSGLLIILSPEVGELLFEAWVEYEP